MLNGARSDDMVIQDITKLDNKYGIIYTDPPWQQRRGGKKAVRPNSSGMELDYPTLPLQDIVDLHRWIFGNNTTDKHNVFIWTIDKYLRETEDFMEELGYTRHARIIWDKVIGIPTAFTVRYCHEYLLWYYRKGNILMPRPETRGVYSDVIHEQPTKHSKKPICAYEMIEDMFQGVSKLELFARSERSGWDSFGDEIGSQYVADMRSLSKMYKNAEA